MVAGAAEAIRPVGAVTPKAMARDGEALEVASTKAAREAATIGAQAVVRAGVEINGVAKPTSGAKEVDLGSVAAAKATSGAMAVVGKEATSGVAVKVGEEVKADKNNGAPRKQVEAVATNGVQTATSRSKVSSSRGGRWMANRPASVIMLVWMEDGATRIPTMVLLAKLVLVSIPEGVGASG